MNEPEVEKHRVNKKTRPDLDWNENPRVFWIVQELVQSDAFRSLSKIETDIILWIFSRRQYPYGKEKKRTPRDYWNPLNRHDMKIPYVAVLDFFSGKGMPPPNPSSIARAINSLMHRGFLEPLIIGGRGKGDMSVYRLAHEWRVWREGDPPVYTKAGMSNAKGFCVPGSGIFCPVKLEKGRIHA